MDAELLQERFFEILISGDRPVARTFVDDLLKNHEHTPQDLITEMYWPVYEKLDKLFRQDQLSALAHHTATRLLRVLVDQNSARLKFQKPLGRTVFCSSGASEADEMGAQMAVDLLETYGFTVTFTGGGIASDEILGEVNERKPDVLLMFASSPSDLPNIRALVDTLHQIGACPNMQIAVGGGVFNRAEGLSEEVGADLWASNPLDMVEALMEQKDRRASADQRTVGKNRVKQKKAAA